MCHSTGKKFENTEMFGQYPLQVNGFKDLHECLEAAMIEGEIESLHSAENSARSGQEVSNKKIVKVKDSFTNNSQHHLSVSLFTIRLNNLGLSGGSSPKGSPPCPYVTPALFWV